MSSNWVALFIGISFMIFCVALLIVLAQGDYTREARDYRTKYIPELWRKK